jgi:hypothetical protein
MQQETVCHKREQGVEMNLARRVVNVLMLTNADDELRDAALQDFYPRTKSIYEVRKTKVFVMDDDSLVMERDGAVLCADDFLQAWEILSEPDDEDARLMGDDLIRYALEQNLHRNAKLNEQIQE